MRSVIMAAALLIALPCGADSLFSKETEEQGSLITNKQKRYKVGDIITVMVRESVDASTRSNTDTKKESDVEAQTPIAANQFFVGNPPQGNNIFNASELPNWQLEMENETKARGTTTRANRLTTTVACSVVRVHENGNIDVEGNRRVTVNREDSKLYVRGTLRSVDVATDNSVDSTKLANAEIELKGQGPLWNNERRGLFTRLLDWVSPF